MTETGTQVAKTETFPQILEKFKREIARALPKHLSADRMARIALTCFRKNPKLAACDPKSVFAAVIMAAQLGLEPGVGGQSYLIPYGRECQFVPGWQGLVDLASRSGRASVWTGAVYRGDEFDYSLGDSPYVTHKPVALEEESKLSHVYAVGRVNGSEWPVVEVWPLGKILLHRDRYNKVGKGHYSFENLEMYGRKVALLQVLKYMPKSVELQMAVGLDQAATAGEQRLTVEDAIDSSSWVEPEAPGPIEVKKSGTEAVKEQLKGQMLSDAKKQEAHEAEMQTAIWPKREPGE